MTGPGFPHEEDIRVAGASHAAPGSFGDPGAPAAGDTAGMPPVPGGEPGAPGTPGDPYGPGDPYAPPGDPFGPQGDPYAPQGDAFGPQGESFGAQSDMHAPEGDAFAGPGETQVAPGEPFPAGPMRPRDEISGRGGNAPRRLNLPSGVGLKVAAVAAGAVVVLGGGGAAAFALTGSDGSDSGNATASPSTSAAPLADAAAPKVDVQALEAQRRKQALDRASRATRGGSGKAPTLHAKGKPLPTKTPDGSGGGSGIPSGDPVPASEAQRIAKGLLSSYGAGGKGQFSCLVSLWNKESHWNTHAANPSGAYGIPQALPGSKMASAGPDWRNNATTQIKWGLGYIKGRYGTPCGAWSHSQSSGWY
ncbi:lytic transglycosylase domain-containing protein [Actinomadura barringtoniae]|uniref:Lytic transglycosylase domain-containing protein n=1 Tax=Actinomadura barringtoniae TaxID=1427535 RepID=A0A939T3M3_9ACTN|nr:lytic transglycosylase domain-containing protein [Actinomadura barringtoniae]MBO2446904.1 lytic transglycosylase domain-containing protein [Actinomadura barringtoniae]